jgi:ssDNA-binding replication factor A large subunit
MPKEQLSMQLIDGDRGVNIDARVVNTGNPIITQISYLGQTVRTHVVSIENDTGTCLLRLWNEQIALVDEGDYVRIRNGFVSTNHHLGITSLNIGRHTTMEVNPHRNALA